MIIPEENPLPKCWCNGELISEENWSLEHVIPRSLGGYLSSRDLLCVICNRKFGETIDVELDKQLGFIADQLGIKKQGDKNNNKRYTATAADGSKKVVGKKLKPHSKITLPGSNGEKVDVYIPDSEVEDFVKKKREEYSRKGITVDFIESVEQPDGKAYHFENNLSEEYGHIAFGGPKFNRAIAKIAINFAILKGIKIVYLKEVIKFVKGELSKNDYVNWYYPTHYLIREAKENEAGHLIFLKGDTQHRILYAYIELFNTHNLIVMLNVDYEGPEVQHTYAWDTLEGKEINENVKIRMIRGHFLYLWMSQDNMRHEHVRKYHQLERLIERNQMKS